MNWVGSGISVVICRRISRLHNSFVRHEITTRYFFSTISFKRINIFQLVIAWRITVTDVCFDFVYTQTNLTQTMRAMNFYCVNSIKYITVGLKFRSDFCENVINIYEHFEIISIITCSTSFDIFLSKFRSSLLLTVSIIINQIYHIEHTWILSPARKQIFLQNLVQEGNNL